MGRRFSKKRLYGIQWATVGQVSFQGYASKKRKERGHLKENYTKNIVMVEASHSCLLAYSPQVLKSSPGGRTDGRNYILDSGSHFQA